MEHAPHSPEQHSQPSPELHHQPPALEAKTPQERSIGSLEQLDINVQTKLELLLTVGGENPSYAMRYAIPVSANGEVAPDPEARKQIEAINGWAKSTGLPTEIVTFEPPAHDPSVT
ncbi:MAG: hypothetical protein K0S68_1142, partial [Candidatus Saccharibacteria bacterium]|nr:hypothetical protein [Candidatus Saccharibacteria bacterium]